MCSGMNNANRVNIKEKTKIVIVVEKGMVMSVYHNNPNIELETLIADFDLPLADNMWKDSVIETDAGKVVLQDVESFEDSDYVNEAFSKYTEGI